MVEGHECKSALASCYVVSRGSLFCSNMKPIMRTFRAHIARYGVDDGRQDSEADQGSGVAVKYARNVTPVCPATAVCQGVQ
jgi:hypothetical protein